MAEKNLLVMKFGGTSVGTVQAMAQVVEIVQQARQEWQSVIVITSALSGVTNLLLQSAHQATQGNYLAAEAQLRQMHQVIADQLINDMARRAQTRQEINHLLTEFTNLCRAIEILGEASPRALDAVASLGERMCVRLLSAAIESAGIPAQFVDASQLIVTDAQYMDAHPNMAATTQKTRQMLMPLLDQGRVPVITGFIGATPDGVITTLGRGGSDYSAGIIGAVLPADDVWIWTDVDGVMSADPRIVPEARTINELTYREIAELAYYGAKVLHPKTVRPVIETGIGLRICNTFNPAHPGTRLVSERTSDGSVAKAVTAIRGQRLITIEGRGMLGVPGVAARTFAAVAATGTSVPLITQASSEQSICFAVPVSAADQVVSSVSKTFASELANRDIDKVWASQEVVIITVVGIGMIHTPGIAGKIFSAVGAAKINVIAIAQGSSEVSISLVVEAKESDHAVRTLHALIIEENSHV